MKIKICILFIYLFGFIYNQESSSIYWNSLSTELIIKVPIIEDNTLENGQVQISVSFNKSKSFKKLGDPVKIDKDDIDDIKEVSISADIFESMNGFKENARARFKTEIWDRVGNNTPGEVGDSILIIDQTPPKIINLKVTSSNSINSDYANPEDSITFILDVNEPINNPSFLINNETYLAKSTSETSWKLNYKTEDSDEGLINFEIYYEDLAKNPGEVVTKASNGEEILFDGTKPELTKVTLYTSNYFDKLMAKEADTVFLEFVASESIQNIKVVLSGKEAIKKSNEELEYKYYYVFTKNDSNGIVPVSINFDDLAGNKGEAVEETSDDTFITLDTNPPQGSKIHTVGSNFDGIGKKKSKKSKKKPGSSKKISQDLFGIPILYVTIGASVFVFLLLAP